jgi:pyrroline-5-carboxylate reductase
MTLENIAPFVLVGAGKMGGAMLTRWLHSGLDARDTIILDPNMEASLQAAWKSEGVKVVSSPKDIDRPKVMVLAVKPQVMDHVLGDVAPLAGPHTTVVSVAAGISLQQLSGAFGPDVGVVRAMPNTPSQIGKGMTVACANSRFKQDMRTTISALFETLGLFEWLDDEAQIDAVTAVSGSGPAYVFHMVEALAEAGVAHGLSEELSKVLARQTIIGAAGLLEQSHEQADVLRKNVTSPSGTTEAALSVLMSEDGLPLLMQKAVEAAAKRSRELSQ